MAHCQFCHEISYGAYRNDIPLSEFQRGRQTGCRGCDLILCAVEAYKPGWITGVETRPRSLCLEDGDQISSLTIQLQEYEKGKGYKEGSWTTDYVRIGSFMIFAKQNDVLYQRIKVCQFASSLEIIPDSSSPAAFSRALDWLGDCLSNHENCKPPDPNFKPTRLIDIGSEQRQPFLFSPAVALPYIALSYCWGKDLRGVVSTRKQNLERHLLGIDRSSLPRTLNDAISVCKGLGIQYLWIDSLCIIQDDAEDWQRESGNMRHIYSNAHLSISADFPDSCKLGFLGPQAYGQPGWQIPLTTNFEDVYDSQYKMYYHSKELLIRTSFPPRRDFDGDVDGADALPLATRGWTLQESILPVRTLSYTGNELVWSCNTRHLCECSHLTYEGGGNFSWLKTALGKKQFDRETEVLNVSWNWRSVVQQYSTRKLTQDTDKLSAISGVVQLIEDAKSLLGGPRDRYLAGLWESDLAFGMTWFTIQVPDKTLHTRPTKYRAPSWSWASLDGKVGWSEYTNSRYDIRSELTVENWYYKPFSPLDPTGAVAEAYLVVTGLLAPAQMVVLTKSLKPGDWSYGSYHGTIPRALVRGKNLKVYEFSLDIHSFPYTSIKSQERECWDAGYCRQDRCGCTFDKGNVEFFCLQVCKVHWEQRRSEYLSIRSGQPLPRASPDPTIHYVVLKKSGRVSGAYERIGSAYSNQFYPYGAPFADGEIATIKLV